MIANRQEQRTSVKTKQSESWYIPNIHYFITLATSLNDKKDTQTCLDGANGIVDTSTYNYVLSPMQKGESKEVTQKLPGEIPNVDFINPIREKNIGEYLSLPENYTVKVDDPNITLLRNKQVADKIIPLLQQYIINLINKNQNNPNALQNNINQQQNNPQQQQSQQQVQQQPQQPQQSQQPVSGINSSQLPDIEKAAKEFVDDWFDKRAENVQYLLEWIKDNNDFENKKITAFNYWWATENCYFYTYILNNSLEFDVISPLEGFTVNNGHEFVQDHDAFVIIRKLSLTRIEETYSNDLTNKDREYLSYLKNNSVGGICTVSVDTINNIYGRREFLNDITSGAVSVDTNADIREVILLFKTQVERKILYKYNNLGKIVTEVITDKDFVFNPDLGHIRIDKEWIIETWKQVLLGDDYSGIYLKPVPIDAQIYDKSGKNRLPVIGKKGLLNGVYINPIPKRILPNLALYRVITLHIERQFAKFKGTVELIPKSLLMGDKGDIKGNMFYRLASNTIIYDEEYVQNAIQGYRLVGDDSAVNYIKALIDFRTMIKSEAWDMANMNESRYGNAPASSTVTNNQQNIFRAKLGSALMISTFNSILLKLYEQLIEYSKYTYVDGVSGVIYDKNEHKPIYFNIGNGELTENQYGIFVSNSLVDLNKLDEYKKLAFNASQNGEVEMAMAAIDGDNVSSIRKHLKDLTKLKQERQKEIELEKANIQLQTEQTKANNDAANRQNKIDVVKITEQLQTKREVQIEKLKLNI